MIRSLRFVVVALAAVGGCATTTAVNPEYKALAARVDNRPTYNDSARFMQKRCVPGQKDYVMWSMEYASLCLLGGNYDAARKELLVCYKNIQTAEDENRAAAAVISDESLKLFKGEPFERAMLCTYLGWLHYIAGDYNNARIFLARADMEDATTEDDMADFRHDFQLAHYWLGRAYLQLDQPDNARVAFNNAANHVQRKNEQAEKAAIQRQQKSDLETRVRLEQKSFKEATTGKKPVANAADMSACTPIAQAAEKLPWAVGESPVIASAATPKEFFTVDYQKEVNLIIMIETGVGPIKYLVGENQFMDAIMRAPYPERQVLVYLDGHKAGQAFEVLDMFHQADTRGTSDKDRAQLAKGITQSILVRMPYVGYVAQYWNVRADWRYWRLIPGEVHVYAAQVKPGLYTLNLQAFDSNGAILPRYGLTRYYLPVQEGRENVYMMHISPEADNQYEQGK
jgi:tetratricopeptide (TPR) repeat protein